MHSKSLLLLALSASAVIAKPFHEKRVPHRGHHRLHSTRLRATGTGGFSGNGTASTTTTTITITVTDSSIDATEPANFAAAAADQTTSCTSTSITTETSINLVTVTAASTGAAKIEAGSNPGAFYGKSGRYSQQSSSTTQQYGNPSQPSASASSTFGSGAASASAAASAPASGSSGGKRGISFNDASLVSAFGGAVSWAYNWADSESGSMNGVEYVPMMWGTNSVSGFANKVGNAKHVLSFNEPDLDAQSNMDAATAAKLHRQVMEGLRGQVQIGSPAVTNGVQKPNGDPMGVAYLDAFFGACGNNCPVDFVAYHWYGGADNLADFQRHTNDVIQVANKYGVSKVWCTEFAPSGSSDAQATFMSGAVSFLDSTTAVERYAAFMASEGTLLSGGKLNSAGTAYASA